MKWRYCDRCGLQFPSFDETEIICANCDQAELDKAMEDDFEADSGVFCGACGMMVQEVRNGLCRACANKPKGAA